MHLLKHALHNTCPDMMKSIGKDEHGNDIKMRDSEGIQLANAKIDEIRNGFSEWLEEQSPQFKAVSYTHLLRGLHYSRYAILREVVENEFADEVPEEKREAFVLKLLPLVGNVFSVYDLSDDNFALSSDYDLLYTELTGATVLYIGEYGV